MKKIILSFFVVFGLARPMVAQHYLGIYFGGSSPTGQLKDSGFSNGFGYAVEYLSPSLFSGSVLKKPFEIKIGAGFERFVQGNSKKIDDVVMGTPNNDLGSVKFQNRMFGIYVAPKFIINFDRFSPYADLFIGALTYRSYQVSTLNNTVKDYKRVSSKGVLGNDFKLHTGVSIGCMYNLSKTVVFDARVSYTKSGAVEFANFNTITRDPNYNTFVYCRAIDSPSANMVTYRVGILYKLPRLFKKRNKNE
jgi:hypothetical protein